jgi:hypothetical protein
VEGSPVLEGLSLALMVPGDIFLLLGSFLQRLLASSQRPVAKYLTCYFDTRAYSVALPWMTYTEVVRSKSSKSLVQVERIL